MSKTLVNLDADGKAWLDREACLRRSERRKLPDALQAAVAMTHGLVLATRDSKDFRDGEGLRVVVFYAL